MSDKKYEYDGVILKMVLSDYNKCTGCFFDSFDSCPDNPDCSDKIFVDCKTLNNKFYKELFKEYKGDCND